ncbi:hypothetical protein BJ165DRAFT_1515459 [Panaeolus papilionaceus]|nr:hypothetical protein BJ165DRAFT_1515459 [Panaeolus papilionaceus]
MYQKHAKRYHWYKRTTDSLAFCDRDLAEQRATEVDCEEVESFIALERGGSCQGCTTGIAH